MIIKLSFKLTDETKINFLGKKLFRIEATADLTLKGGEKISKGDRGGWVESDLVNGNARVSGDAWVFGDAWVSGDALSIKADLWELLLHAIPEIPALRQAIIDGKVDGSVYEGECACLCGTIANVRKCEYTELDGIKPDSNRPAEAYFMGIKKGETPEANPIAKQVLQWIDELLSLVGQSNESKG